MEAPSSEAAPPARSGGASFEPAAGSVERVRRFPPLLVLVYLGIGVAVAAERDYFQNVHGVKPVVAAVLAILLWPLLLLDLIAIKRR